MTVILPKDMYDAIPSLVGNIPTNAFAVAGYVDSIDFTWPQSAWDRFPNSLHCTITTTGRVRAHFADCENGDLTDQQAHDLYQSGGCRGIYCNFARWQAVQDIFNANHHAQPPYWIAEYPGGGRVLPVLNGIEAIAHQYASTPGYDLSCITPAFVALIGGSSVVLGNDDIQAIAAAVLFNTKIAGPNGPTPYSTNDMEYWNNFYIGQILAQVNKLTGALSADEAAILAAVQQADGDTKAGIASVISAIAALPAGQPPTAAQMAALTAAIVKALPGYTVNIVPTGGTA